MKSLVFRAFEKKDIPLLEKWYEMTDIFGYATGFKSISELEKLLENDIHDKIAWMIEDGNETIGFIFAEIYDKEHKPVLWIYILIIESNHQHQGYGSSAVRKLIDEVKLKYGSITCVASVSKENKQGLSFWEKVGFMRSPALENTLDDSKNVAIFQKSF
ncbi:MAG: GNAT family N-acetyltransferase [Clostridiaceae bacterium]|nr:GNAT family N-acetyltransferase [Clostridiaceae bacterium]